LNAAEGVIVLAATNFIDTIDPAILRSGRFDTKIAVPYPDKTGVRDILAHYVGADIVLDDTTINKLLDLSGADLANIARDAKRRARKTREPLRVLHLKDAVDAVVPAVSHEKLYRIAAHEAGHLVMAAQLDLPLPVRARVSPTGGEIIRPAPEIYTPETIKHELAYLMGGRAAEQVLLGSISSGSGGGAGSDLDQATDIVIAQEHQWGLGQGGGLFHAPVGLKQRHTLTKALSPRTRSEGP
jgi:cell division protease FtsH